MQEEIEHKTVNLAISTTKLPQQKLHSAQQGAGRQFCGLDGKVDRLMLDFFLHRYHLLCRKSP